MFVSKQKCTKISSIILILLREIRIGRNFPQSHIAESIGKKASAWTKIEAGDSTLSLDVFMSVCNILTVQPSIVMAAAERYAIFLGNKFNNTAYGIWNVSYKEDAIEKDDLMDSAKEYWKSMEFRNRHLNPLVYESVLNGPIHNVDGTVTMSPVFKFALDQESRRIQSFGVPPFINY